MIDLKKLQTKMQELIAELEALQGKLIEAQEEKNEDEVANAKTLIEDKESEFDNLKAKVEDAKKHQAKVKLLEEVKALAKPETEISGKTMPEGTPAEAKDPAVEAQGKDAAFYRWVQGKTLSGEQRKLIAPREASGEESKSQDAVVIPERLACRIMGPTYAAAFGKTMYSVAAPASPALNPSAAQNLVPPDFRAQLLHLPYDQPSVYDRVTVIPSGTGTVTWPSLVQTAANEFGGVAFQWLGEGAEKPETEPEFEQKEIQTHELCGYTEVSDRLLSRSSINLENLLAELFRGAMVYTIDNAILQGTGTGMPLGIVATAGINLVARATANQVAYADLVNLKHAVKSVHRGGASYVLEDSVEQGLELQVDSQGRPLFRASVANGPYDRLIGYPYIVGTNNPTLGTSGDIVYGNLKLYILVMEEEITLAKSTHVKFRENKTAYKVFTVVGGRLLQPRGMSILEGES